MDGDAPSIPPSTVKYAADAPARLDTWLSEHVQTYSRSRWQALIRDGHVRVNDTPRKPNYQLRAGDRVSWDPSPSRVAALLPEALPLAILFEDAHMLVVNKAAGMVVHPAPGHDGGTLINAVLHHCPDLPGIGGERRPGLVHRLDRDTSGALVVAKTEAALLHLQGQFHDRRVEKEYLALVWGTPRPATGTVHTRIGRSAHDRKKMTALPLTSPIRRRLRFQDEYGEEEDGEPAGREAVTHYAVEEALGPVSLLRCRIETGRTHQIRVHLAHLRHPIVGDATYGKSRGDLPAPADRQMLHAGKLVLDHPATGARMTFLAPLPPDFQALLRALRRANA
jgi:23S rRNA pseudouridine1911/1915/1917 synthase